MRDADGYSFREVGRTRELSSPAGGEEERSRRRKEKRDRTHARSSYGICAMRMQNMTSHDMSRGVPQLLMTEHDIS